MIHRQWNIHNVTSRHHRTTAASTASSHDSAAISKMWSILTMLKWDCRHYRYHREVQYLIKAPVRGEVLVTIVQSCMVCREVNRGRLWGGKTARAAKAVRACTLSTTIIRVRTFTRCTINIITYFHSWKSSQTLKGKLQQNCWKSGYNKNNKKLIIWRVL